MAGSRLERNKIAEGVLLLWIDATTQRTHRGLLLERASELCFAWCGWLDERASERASERLTQVL
jgi:hypothetical protein